jgi:hypothetical protein
MEMNELEREIRDALNQEQFHVNAPEHLRTRVQRGALGLGVLRALAIFYLGALVAICKGVLKKD